MTQPQKDLIKSSPLQHFNAAYSLQDLVTSREVIAAYEALLLKIQILCLDYVDLDDKDKQEMSAIYGPEFDFKQFDDCKEIHPLMKIITATRNVLDTLKKPSK